MILFSADSKKDALDSIFNLLKVFMLPRLQHNDAVAVTQHLDALREGPDLNAMCRIETGEHGHTRITLEIIPQGPVPNATNG